MIDADVLLNDNTWEWFDDYGNYTVAGAAIAEAPTVDAAPVVHGEWKLHGNDDDCGCSYFCSNCHHSYDEDWFYEYGEFTPFKYCPNCGANMRGEK